MDNHAIDSLEHVGRGETFCFSTLQLSNITIAFLPPNVTSVEQPFDQGNNCFIHFNIRNGFSLSLILLLLTRLEGNSAYYKAIMWWSQVQDSNHTKLVEDVQYFTAYMCANFSMDDECEKIKNERSNK